jgi:hypothetical protein
LLLRFFPDKNIRQRYGYEFLKNLQRHKNSQGSNEVGLEERA